MENPDHNTTDGIDPTQNIVISETEALSACTTCGEMLCQREKVINLALGNTEIMYCLPCLGKQESSTEEQLLAKIKKYILARECFRKEWIKYKDISYCPKSQNCLPHASFD